MRICFAAYLEHFFAAVAVTVAAAITVTVAAAADVIVVADEIWIYIKELSVLEIVP